LKVSEKMYEIFTKSYTPKKGDIVLKNGHTEFINSDMKFKINQTHPQKKKLARDMPIIMGIRPEDIHDNLFAAIKDGYNTVSASVELVENMGSPVDFSPFGASPFAEGVNIAS